MYKGAGGKMGAGRGRGRCMGEGTRVKEVSGGGGKEAGGGRGGEDFVWVGKTGKR